MRASIPICSNRRNNDSAGRFVAIGPWGIACTALLLVLGSLLGGCRQPAPPPAQGWVRLPALTALHPEQAMVADIDRRLATLTAQRQHLLGTTLPASPPIAIEQVTPALPALPAPQSSPQLDRHTDQLLAQRLESFAQLLERDRLRKVDLFRRHQLETMAAEKAQVRPEPLAAAEQQRVQLREEFYIPLTDAKVALNIARENAKEVTDQPSKELEQAQAVYDAVNAKYRKRRRQIDAKAKKEIADAEVALNTARENAKVVTIRPSKELEQAQAAYDAVNAKYRKRLQQIDAKAKKEIADAEARIDDQYAGALEQYDRQLRESNAALHDKRRTELAAEADPAAEVIPVPSLVAPAIPAGRLVLDAAGLEEQYRRSGQQLARNRQAASGDIDRVITQLRRERQELLTRITRDTREAAAAVAMVNGYQLSFDTAHGRELTGQVREWLGAYWKP